MLVQQVLYIAGGLLYEIYTSGIFNNRIENDAAVCIILMSTFQLVLRDIRSSNYFLCRDYKDLFDITSNYTNALIQELKLNYKRNLK